MALFAILKVETGYITQLYPIYLNSFSVIYGVLPNSVIFANNIIFEL